MNKNMNGSKSCLLRLDSVSEILNWALNNGEQITILDRKSELLSARRREFNLKWDNRFHVNLTAGEGGLVMGQFQNWSENLFCRAVDGQGGLDEMVEGMLSPEEDTVVSC